jgi:GntR family transcriptional regulator
VTTSYAEQGADRMPEARRDDAFSVEQIELNRDAPTPLYLQLQARLRAMIRTGDLPGGVALPSERVLCEQLDMSRMTVRRAVEALVEEGLLERRHGSGTYVRPERVRQAIDRVLGFADEMRLLGKEAGSRLVEFSRIPAPLPVARALRIDEGTEVSRVVRLREADGRPLALQTAFLPPRFEPFTLEQLLANGSLYATFAAVYGVSPHAAHQTVTARLPSEEEARLLQIDVRSPVLATERTTVDADENVIEHVCSAYRGDAYQLELVLSASTSHEG